MRHWDWGGIGLVAAVLAVVALIGFGAYMGERDKDRACAALLGQAATARDSLLVLAAKPTCTDAILPTPAEQRKVGE